MPDTISPVTREEDYLAAIAGQDVTPPTPVTRKEEWLDLIAGKVDDLAGDIEDLQDVVPTPEAADSGKVLTAGADGTASWQTPGGGIRVIKATGTCTYTPPAEPTDPYYWEVDADISLNDFTTSLSSGDPMFVCFPPFTDTSPYYDYSESTGITNSIVTGMGTMAVGLSGTYSLVPDDIMSPTKVVIRYESGGEI